MASARFPPTNSNDFRLPSLKDLNFPYKPLQDEQQPWSRGPHENSSYSVPLSAQAAPIQPVAVPVSQNARVDEAAAHSPSQSKRARIVPREIRTPHTPYPPQYAPYPQQQQQPPGPPTYHPASAPASVPPHPPPPHDHIHPHPVPMPSHPAYSPYPSQYIPTPRPPPVIHPHHPHQQPPHANPYPSPGPPPSAPPPQGQWLPPHHQHSSQPASHLHHQPAPPPSMAPQHHHSHPHHQQPPPPGHVPPHAVTHQPPPQIAHLPPANQPQHPQQQQQQQQQQPSFPRSTAIVPANVDTRDPYEADDLDPMPSLRDGLMVEVVKRCSTLYSFAKNHAQFQTAIPHAQPPTPNLTEMSRLAVDVVNMLEQWKHTNISQADRIKLDNVNGFTANDDSRPPKRPWEDMSRGSAQEGPDTNENNAAPDATQSTAEQDMELIRTKRASSTAGGSGTVGQPKSKYRKRSRATPPGKCHSCNIRETPEWRRGPDGARTLCNACGLHYAKLMRKKEKSGNGGAEQISLEDLRASARASDMEKARSKGRAQQSNDSASSSVEGTKQEQTQPPTPQQHHQGSFQLMSLAPDSNGGGGPSTMAETSSHIQAANQQAIASNPGPISIPSHPWPTTAQPQPPPQPRYASDQFQHQSFMRSSQHVAIPQASPR